MHKYYFSQCLTSYHIIHIMLHVHSTNNKSIINIYIYINTMKRYRKLWKYVSYKLWKPIKAGKF
jgi:hypothetical protein